MSNSSAPRYTQPPGRWVHGDPSSRSEEHTSELQSRRDLVCRLLRPPTSTLFPYTTLFRSCGGSGRARPLPRCSHRNAGVRPIPAGSPNASPSASAHRRAECRTRVHRGTHNLPVGGCTGTRRRDRKSTRLNSSHVEISYAVFCAPRHLHSFPTRRSSDLAAVAVVLARFRGAHTETLEFGQYRPDHRTLLLQRVHIAEQNVELECTEVHTTSRSVGARGPVVEIGRAHV